MWRGATLSLKRRIDAIVGSKYAYVVSQAAHKVEGQDGRQGGKHGGKRRDQTGNASGFSVSEPVSEPGGKAR